MAYVTRLRQHLGHDLLLIPSVAAGIKDIEGRILILRRGEEPDLWSFPGGGIEPGESAVDAVVREVLEEIGLHVEPTALIGVYSSPDYAFTYPNGDQVQPVTTFFACRVLGGEIRPDQREIIAARYFGPGDELPRMHPCCVAKARDAFSFQGQSFFR